MAAKSTRAEKARQAAQSAGSNPYVRRLIEDQELRNSVKDAFDSARDAYTADVERQGPGQGGDRGQEGPARPRSAAESLRDASDRLRGKSQEAPLGQAVRDRAGRRRRSRSRSARIFARRSSTVCSAPRRSSSTPRQTTPTPEPTAASS